MTQVPAGAPEQVNVHDFPGADLGKAMPHGIDDVSAGTRPASPTATKTSPRYP
jgi:hypothetical protein